MKDKFDAARETKDFALEVAEAITGDSPIEGWRIGKVYDGDTEFRFERNDGCAMQVQVVMIRRPNDVQSPSP